MLEAGAPSEESTSLKGKIIVFGSVDWGGVRMPSQEVYLELLGQGVRVDLFLIIEKSHC